MSKALAEALSVSQILHFLKEILESELDLADLWVRGEIAEVKVSAAGHCYFTLKDDRAAMRCVIFRNAMYPMPRLRVGMQTYLHGKLSIYEQRGDLQLYVDALEEAGIGLLYQQFLAMKAELTELGLLDPERKRPIPLLPRTIGIVTSSDAAALRDILRTLQQRWPLAEVILAPTLVQGPTAAPQIVRAIRRLNAQGSAEVIIIARGGGSIEDLWAFNEREVALAIAESAIPTVTGIGHETDFTIADFVADQRAATPTAAAAACTPDINTFRAAVAGQRQRMLVVIQEMLEHRRDDVAVQLHRLSREHPRELYDRARQQIDELVERMQQAIRRQLALDRERLSGSALRLQALSPLLTIARGYGVVTRDRDAAPVLHVADVIPPEAISVRLGDGTLRATVTAAERTATPHAPIDWSDES